MRLKGLLLVFLCAGCSSPQKFPPVYVKHSQIIVSRFHNGVYIRFRLFYEDGSPVMGNDQVDDKRQDHLGGYVAKWCWDCEEKGETKE